MPGVSRQLLLPLTAPLFATYQTTLRESGREDLLVH
jgi:hypothetical protein